MAAIGGKLMRSLLVSDTSWIWSSSLHQMCNVVNLHVYQSGGCEAITAWHREALKYGWTKCSIEPLASVTIWHLWIRNAEFVKIVKIVKIESALNHPYGSYGTLSHQPYFLMRLTQVHDDHQSRVLITATLPGYEATNPRTWHGHAIRGLRERWCSYGQ